MSHIDGERGEELLIQIRGGIVREREYQDRKWGTVKDHPHTVPEWIAIMQWELYEAREAWFKKTSVDCLREILQVAAVGIACFEQHGNPEDGYENPTNFESFTIMEWIITIDKTLQIAIDDWIEDFCSVNKEVMEGVAHATQCCIACMAQHGLYERPLVTMI